MIGDKCTIDMDAIFAEIELLNGDDIALHRKQVIDEVRCLSVNMKVDLRPVLPAINEHIQKYLQLPVVGKQQAILLDGSIVDCDVVAPMEVRFKNRSTTCRAIVLPSDGEPALGGMAINDTDVLIHPLRQELIVNPAHPYFAVMKMK